MAHRFITGQEKPASFYHPPVDGVWKLSLEGLKKLITSQGPTEDDFSTSEDSRLQASR